MGHILSGNTSEDLSERWKTIPTFIFCVLDKGFRKDMGWVATCARIQNAKVVLEKMFGEKAARTAVEEHIKAFEPLRQSGRLATERGSGLIVPVTTASSTAIPRNTFYGDYKRL